MRKLVMLAAATAATAAVLVEPSTASAATPVTHCGFISTTGATACFNTLDQVNAWAAGQSGGSVSAAPTGSAASPAAAASSFLQGEFYVDAGYGGNSLSIFGSGACDGNHSTADYFVPDLTVQGWNDAISSFKGFSNCYIKLYENKNYNQTPGATYGPYDHSTNVGSAMNDQASSIKFF